ncbi:MAG TPA: hypothetical protein VLH60_02090, partial [Sedimentisphaerales bacterium]|nr:hypothetical protein [Sedimentisphaerales bacterium]
SFVTRVGGSNVTTPVHLRSTGNDLNNYSDHMTKLFTNIRLADDRLTLHGNAKVFWGFTGAKDGVDMVRRGGGWPLPYDELEERDAHGMLINGNVSLTWHFDRFADLSFYVQNIPIRGDNKRYAYSSGHRRAVPDRTGWIEEPMMVGARFTARF